MQIKKIYVLILIFFAIIILIFGLFLNGGSYQGDSFSFNYPHNWNINNESKDGSTKLILNPNNYLGRNNEILISVNGPESGFSDLNDYKNYLISDYKQVYQYNRNTTPLVDDPNFKVFNYTKLNVNDLKGFYIAINYSEYGIFGNPSTKTEIVIFQKGNKFYSLELKYSANALNSSEYVKEAYNGFMTIVNSFKVN